MLSVFDAISTCALPPAPGSGWILGSLLPFQGLTCWAGVKHSPPSAPLAPSLQPKRSRDDPKHRGPCPSFLSMKTLWVGRHNSCCRAFHRSAIIPTVLYGAAFIRLSTTEVWGHILSPVQLPRAGSRQDASSKPMEPAVTQLEGPGSCSGLGKLLMSKLPPAHAMLHWRAGSLLTWGCY